MSARVKGLVALDGLNGMALAAAARTLVVAHRADGAGTSGWGASGIFDELGLAGPDAGVASARTLLLLYAADLAFRLRWEIRPALGHDRLVVAAPYVRTAVAFGRALGLDEAWLSNLFAFAPRPESDRIVAAPPARAVADRTGFVEFAWQHLEHASPGLTRRAVMDKARARLGAAPPPPPRAATARVARRPPRR